MLDGELVALQPDGVSSFPLLQAALKAGRDGDLTFYAFDLLHLNGWDLRPCALLERKRVLAATVRWSDTVRFSGHHEGQVAELQQSACAIGLEGIICKRADRP
jgi:bifunctional non-homologous end joining protein LigD